MALRIPPLYILYTGLQTVPSITVTNTTKQTPTSKASLHNHANSDKLLIQT
jgi:hypothetical protein